MSNQRSHQIRNEKLHHVRRSLKKPEIIGSEEGEVLVVAWGSGRGALLEAVSLLRNQGLSVSGLHLKVVYPLPTQLKDIFSKFKFIVTIEVAYGDSLKPTPFATLLRSETLCDVRCLVSDATGRPLKPRHIEEKVKSLLEKKEEMVW